MLASGTMTIPPTDTPVCEKLIARARRVTNHRARIALVGTPELIPNPTAIRK